MPFRNISRSNFTIWCNKYKQNFAVSHGVHVEALLIKTLRYKPEELGSITDSDFRIFHWRNHYGRTMAIELTQESKRIKLVTYNSDIRPHFFRQHNSANTILILHIISNFHQKLQWRKSWYFEPIWYHTCRLL
jgi:hypothetical protein